MTTSHTTDEYTPRAYTQEEVQDEFFEHIAYLVPYWVNTTHYAYADSPLKEKLSGLMHSTYVTLAGCAGGFNASVDMYIHSTEAQAEKAIAEGRNFFPVGLDNADDINDGSLQYHGPEKPGETVTSNPDTPCEWTVDEARELFFTRVNEIFNEQLAKKGTSDLEKGAGLIRGILVMCEGNDPKFEATISLIATPHPDDKEYYLENGENYYAEETNLNAQGRSLTQVWDEFWEKAKKSPNGL